MTVLVKISLEFFKEIFEIILYYLKFKLYIIITYSQNFIVSNHCEMIRIIQKSIKYFKIKSLVQSDIFIKYTKYKYIESPTRIPN